MKPVDAKIQAEIAELQREMNEKLFKIAGEPIAFALVCFGLETGDGYHLVHNAPDEEMIKKFLQHFLLELEDADEDVDVTVVRTH
jgi:hypothetical protein